MCNRNFSVIAPELIDGKGMCGLSTRIELRADEVIKGQDVRGM